VQSRIGKDRIEEISGVGNTREVTDESPPQPQTKRQTALAIGTMMI
jgi:hypothetical protein